MEGWHPRALRAEWSRSGGSFVAGARPKQVLHTTESGPDYVPDLRPDVGRRRYFGHESWPHATIARVRGRATIVQHGPIDVAARALFRARGASIMTNRAAVVQVEIAWVAKEAADLSDDLAEAVADWVGWVAREHGTGLGLPPGAFHAYPPPMRLGTEPWRMADRAWLGYRGICGHQHVGEGNVHGDPGDLPIGRILERAAALWPASDPLTAATQHGGGPFMALTDDEQREILTAARELRRLPAPPEGSLAWALLSTHHLVGLLAAQTPGTAFTARDVADMIIKALPADQAAEVADELSRRVGTRRRRAPTGDVRGTGGDDPPAPDGAPPGP